MHKKKSFHVTWLIWLSMAALLPYVALLRGEYLYDDIQVIESNALLKQVASWPEVFGFVLKPSKPVTNFLLALGQWWGGGSVGVPRGISLFVHWMVVWLIYANLVRLRRSFAKDLPHRFPFWVAFLFALLPIHSEAMGIILFRMEMLGTLFSLLALLVWQRLLEGQVSQRGAQEKMGRWYGFAHLESAVLFMCQGLAALSKEVFLLVLPLTLSAYFIAKAQVCRTSLGKWWLRMVAGQAVWALVMGWLLLKDSSSDFPYADVVGRGVVDGALHVKLAVVALAEGIVKVFTGYGLTIIRLRDRFAPFGPLEVWQAILGLCLFVGLCGWLARRNVWLRLWSVIWLVGIGVYLVIPNINIGSEHYWYFPSVALLTLGVTAIWQLWNRVSRRPKRFVTGVVVAYGLALGSTLITRVQAMQSRVKFYFAELEKHPESAVTWSDLGIALMEKGPKYLPEAKTLIARGKALEPMHPNILTAEFLYYFHANDLTGATQSLKTLLPMFESRPKFLGRFHFHYGLMQEKAGHALLAQKSYLDAWKLEPGKELYRQAYEKLASK